MKRFYGALLLLALIVTGCLWNARAAAALSGRITGQLAQAALLAETGAWEQARRMTEEAALCWERHSFYREVCLNQGDDDRIGRCFLSLREALLRRDPGRYAETGALLTAQLQALSEAEQLRLSGIL